MRGAIAAVATSVGVLMLWAAPAGAAQDIADFDIEVSTTQAGGHPDIRTKFSLVGPGQPEAASEVQIRMPEGMFGNPGALVKCTPAQFALNECSAGTQAGLVTVYANFEGEEDFIMGTGPLYNLSPRSTGETALLAFVVPIINVPITVPITVRSGSDFGLNLTVRGISQQTPLAGAEIQVWGTPSLPLHSVERFHSGSPGNPPGCPLLQSPACIESPYPESGQPPLPFTDNPSVCTGVPLSAELRVRTYQDPSAVSTAETQIPATTGCDKQRFDPVLDASLTTNEADSPSGLNVSLKADQFLGPAPSPSPIRSSTLSLPEGISINPDAADGQTACTDAEAGFGTEAPSRCPDNSKIGTVEVTTPALEGALKGSLYLGEPRPGNQYRVFMIFEGFGIFAKLAADFVPDPQTGQLTVDIDDLPHVPFEEFRMRLFASDRGLIATPTRCSIYQARGTFVPWNDRLASHNSTAFLSISTGPNGTPCPAQIRPFYPRLVAGASNPQAGAFSSFHLKLDRDDGDQFLGDLNFRMPPGFTGDLRGIAYCPEAAIAAAAANSGRAELASPSCPASSQIGTTNVAAGPGGHPFNAVGRIYLSGSLKGAPLSLAAVTPALAGPYDYGVVVVRVALHVDPRTAQVSAASETMPQIIGGILIRMRSIQVNVDRPQFTINPTNCDPFSVESEGIGDQRTVTNFSSPFQVMNCATMPFRPKFSVTVRGKRKTTRRNQNPVYQFDLRTRQGDANIRSLSLTFPKAVAIDQRHLANICSRSQLAAERCAGRQPIGRAFVRTPLLDEPLSGPAYAVSGFGKLPRVVFILGGQVQMMPEVESTSAKGRLRTIVPIVPDVPIGHFRLTLLGGAKGYLINTTSLCAGRPIVAVRYKSQSGKTLNQNVRVQAPCGKKKNRRASRSSHRR